MKTSNFEWPETEGSLQPYHVMKPFIPNPSTPLTIGITDIINVNGIDTRRPSSNRKLRPNKTNVIIPPIAA